MVGGNPRNGEVHAESGEKTRKYRAEGVHDFNSKQREALLNKRTRQKTSYELKRIFIAIVSVAIVLFAVFLLLNKLLLRVKSFVVTGESAYTYEEVLTASGVAEGAELYGIDTRSIEAAIAKSLPRASSVTVKQVPPSTLRIAITDAIPSFGIKIGEDFYVVADNFKVLERIPLAGSVAIKSVIPQGTIVVEAIAVERCFVGDMIKFSDDDVRKFISEVLELKASGIIGDGDIARIEINDKFRVKAMYRDRFYISLGIFEGAASRISKALQVIEQIPADSAGTIDLTNGHVAAVVYDDTMFGRVSR
ncbi:hypothetical protein FACS1894219_10320 [Clostridia bacterium]|nr:hypothetical protein FACS1894219_10320 [Clostridia bacterium]